MPQISGLSDVQTVSGLPGMSIIDFKELDISLYHNLKSHLLLHGKICPKPWMWGRFQNVYQPKFESMWLVNWWQTTNAEKRSRFLQQLEYLVYETNRFRAAYGYLCALKDNYWHYGEAQSTLGMNRDNR